MGETYKGITVAVLTQICFAWSKQLPSFVRCYKYSAVLMLHRPHGNLSFYVVLSDSFESHNGRKNSLLFASVCPISIDIVSTPLILRGFGIHLLAVVQTTKHFKDDAMNKKGMKKCKHSTLLYII
jgi:hypothetical protein